MKGFQRVVGCLLAVGFLGMMPTPAIAAETPAVIEMPYASSLTEKTAVFEWSCRTAERCM